MSAGETHPDRVTHVLAGDEAGVADAAAILRGGGLVGFPTETVYGLGADATDGRAVASLYAAKARPRFNPLISHLASAALASVEGVFDRDAAALAEAFWPGALTLVVPVAPASRICDLARAGLSSVALRVPSHPLARRLLEAAGRPVVAPSANRSGRVSPTEAAHVLAELRGRIDAVLDGGPTVIGVESTIVACLDDEPRLLRPGGVPRAAIEAVLKRPLAAAQENGRDRPLAPGQLQSHYAPEAQVRLEARSIRPGEAALLFGPSDPPGTETARAVINLSRRGYTAEAASALFSALRRLDASGARVIAIVPIPDEGLGEAVNDRLRRAAAER
jgi:L-threonylcarbamoyladenylate synthase